MSTSVTVNIIQIQNEILALEVSVQALIIKLASIKSVRLRDDPVFGKPPSQEYKCRSLWQAQNKIIILRSRIESLTELIPWDQLKQHSQHQAQPMETSTNPPGSGQ